MISVVFRGQPWRLLYDEISSWLVSHRQCFDVSSGISYLNGSVYYHGITFSSEQDLLAFTLKFGNVFYER